MLGTGDYFDFRFGAMHISALCDDSFEIGKGLLTGASAATIDAYLPAVQPCKASCTACLVRLNGMTVLVDTGAGETFDGHMHEALAKAGVAPTQVDHILLTHLHLDHVGGLLRDGDPVFTNAQIWLAEPEYAFWHDDKATAALSKRLAPDLGDDFIATHMKIARDALAAYDGKVRTFSGAREISPSVPGVTAIPLYGHTPGHCGYLLGAGTEKFFIWGDAVHLAAVQFALPEAGMVFDWDAGMAVNARKQAFEDAASNDWLSAGMHLPFPSMGKLRKDGTAYTFVPLRELP